MNKNEVEKIKLQFKYKLFSGLIILITGLIVSFGIWYHNKCLIDQKIDLDNKHKNYYQDKDIKEIKKSLQDTQKDVAELAGDIKYIKSAVQRFAGIDDKDVNAAEKFLTRNKGRKVVRNLDSEVND